MRRVRGPFFEKANNNNNKTEYLQEIEAERGKEGKKEGHRMRRTATTVATALRRTAATLQRFPRPSRHAHAHTHTHTCTCTCTCFFASIALACKLLQRIDYIQRDCCWREGRGERERKRKNESGMRKERGQADKQTNRKILPIHDYGQQHTTHGFTCQRGRGLGGTGLAPRAPPALAACVRGWLPWRLLAPAPLALFGFPPRCPPAAPDDGAPRPPSSV